VEQILPPPPPPPDPAPQPLTIGRRQRDPQPDNPYGKGDFDAVFEGRSLDGLGDRLLPTTCYLLMIIAPLGLGLPALPAAILAWMAKDRAPDWLRTHYLFILRTFGIALGAVVVAIGSEILVEFMPAQGVVMAGSAVWWLILVVGVAWFVLRSAVGMGRLRRGEAFKRYRTWLV
jgi:uncharacterized membrane protein